MIVVVADDFTGAAEVAGMSAAAGYETLVQRGTLQPVAAQVVVLNTDTRSLPPRAVHDRLCAVGRELRAAGVSRVAKKIDSVLRGSIAAEISGLLEGLGRRRALVTPANPERGRIVRAGRIWVGQDPLEQTLFAADPEYPASTSDVLELLRRVVRRRYSPFVVLPENQTPEEEVNFVEQTLERLAVCTRRSKDHLPERGLVVGDAESTSDLAAWCDRLDDQTLAVGAAEFCGVWLRRQFASLSGSSLHDPSPAENASNNGVSSEAERGRFSPGEGEAGTVVLVCGSPTAWKSGRGRQCELHGVPVYALTPLLAGCDPWLWVMEHDLVGKLRLKSPQIMLTCASEEDEWGDGHGALVHMLARFAATVVRGELPPQWILVEGGATASALVKQLDIPSFRAGQPWAPGVVPLEPIPATGWTLVSKPGSYAWPDWVWGLSTP